MTLNVAEILLRLILKLLILKMGVLIVICCGLILSEGLTDEVIHRALVAHTFVSSFMQILCIFLFYVT